MSLNLKDRLLTHKKLIEKYREESPSPINLDDALIKEKNFAMRVNNRKLAPTRLFVVTKTIKGDEKQYVDVENILNRIYYPILGRN